MLTGLGPTVPELDVSQHKVFPKTCFSMLIPEVEEHIKKMRGRAGTSPDLLPRYPHKAVVNFF